MNITKKAISVGVSAALLASLVAVIAAPTAFATTSVTSVGTIPRGGTSATPATFVFTENAVNSFPATGGTLTVTLTDNAGGSTVHFTGTPVLTANGSLGASMTVAVSGDSFTITSTASDVFTQEQMTVTGLKISADSNAALGAINAVMSGSYAGLVNGATTIATGVLQAPLPASAATVLVAVSSTCGFDPTNSQGQANFSDVSDARNITSSGGTGLVNVGFAAGTTIHNIGVTVTQTVPNCSTALSSPGSVANVVAQGSNVTEQGNNPTTVNPGEQNQAAGWSSITENAAGYIPVGTLTFTLSATGVQFSAPPVVSSLTAALLAPTGLTATATSGGSLVAGAYSYEITATTANGETTPSAAANITTTSTGGVMLTWTAVAGATGYNVYGRTTYLKIASVAGTTYTDTGAITPAGAVPGANTATVPGPAGFTATGAPTGGTLIAGTYFYEVQAVLPAPMNFSTVSAFASVTFTSGATNSVVLAWSAVPGATGYNVFGRPATSAGAFTKVGATTTLLTLTDTGAALGAGVPGTAVVIAVPAAPALSAVTSSGALAAGTYYYVVTATNGSGFTTASNTATATVVGTGSVALSWTAVVGATSYNVYRSTTTTFTTPALLASGVTLTTYTDIGAAVGVGAPATSNTTGGNTTGATVLGSTLCNLAYSRTSCSVSVTTVSTIPSTITLGSVNNPIMLDVASTVLPGTAVNVIVTSSPAINVNISSDTIAYVARVAVGVADQPLIYINYNQQQTGLITITEQGPGFFVGGTGSDNTFGLCLATGESFTFAPYAVVTTTAAGALSLLNGLVGGSSVQGTLYTDTLSGSSCVYWTVYTASTVASTIEIRGTDSTGAVLPTGKDNGPSLSVPAGLAPGTTQGVILIGNHPNVLAGIDVDSGIVDPGDTPAFSSLVSMATRAFKSGVTVTAVTQPMIPAGTPDSLGGNLQLAETLNGQFKPGEQICVVVLPRTSNVFTHQDTFLTAATTNQLPIVTTNASASGLLASSVATYGCSQFSQDNPSYSSFLSLFGGVPPSQTNSFSFDITQQAYGVLGQITISNIHYTTTADAPAGPVLVSVFADNEWAYGPSVDFQTNVSNATIGTLIAEHLSNDSAVGSTTSGPFSNSTKLVSAKGHTTVTLRFQLAPSFAGAKLGIWIATKTNGAWSAFAPHAKAYVDSSGAVYYVYTTNKTVWLSFRAFYAGDAMHAATWSSGTQIRWR